MPRLLVIALALLVALEISAAELSPEQLDAIEALLQAQAAPWYGTPGAWVFTATSTLLLAAISLLFRWVWKLGSRVTVELPNQVLHELELVARAVTRANRAQHRANVYLKAAFRLLVNAAPVEDKHVLHVQNQLRDELDELAAAEEPEP